MGRAVVEAAERAIAAAAVYDSKGQMFASFRRDTAAPLPAACAR